MVCVTDGYGDGASKSTKYLKKWSDPVDSSLVIDNIKCYLQ